MFLIVPSKRGCKQCLDLGKPENVRAGRRARRALDARLHLRRGFVRNRGRSGDTSCRHGTKRSHVGLRALVLTGVSAAVAGCAGVEV